MVIITIKDHTNQCYTNLDGEMIYDQIVIQFERGQQVKVSFKGMDSVSSSFVNSAFINLLEKYDFNRIKSDLGFVDSSKSINDAIKRRFSFEVNERKKLISV